MPAPVRFLVLLLLLLAPAALAQTGRLEPGDRRLDSGEYFDVVERDLPAGTPVVVAIASSDFDPYLIVVDPAGDATFQVDDSPGEGLNVRARFTPATSGRYSLVVTSARPGETGAYTLSVVADPLGLPPVPAAPAAVAAGGVRDFAPRPAAPPPLPEIRPEPGTVRGVVLDRHGAPIAGAKVAVYGTTVRGDGVRFELATGADGSFRHPVPDGIYGISAYVERSYAGERFEISVPAVDGSTAVEHDAALGGVETFVWYLEGLERPDLDPDDAFSYHGMALPVGAGPGFAPGPQLANATLEVLLAPAGPLLDGTPGRPLRYRRSFAPDDPNVLGTVWGDRVELGWELLDIPPGSYTMTARLIDAAGAVVPLRVGDTCCDADAFRPSVTFHPTASSLARTLEPFTAKFVAP